MKDILKCEIIQSVQKLSVGKFVCSNCCLARVCSHMVSSSLNKQCSTSLKRGEGGLCMGLNSTGKVSNRLKLNILQTNKPLELLWKVLAKNTLVNPEVKMNMKSWNVVFVCVYLMLCVLIVVWTAGVVFLRLEWTW